MAKKPTTLSNERARITGLKETFESLVWEFIVDESEDSDPAPAAKEIIETCLEVALMLCDKNRKYGNSALQPMRIFSRADTIEQIDVRIDDKLSRLKTSRPDDNEDAAQDLLGYLILRKVAVKMQAEAEE